MKKIIDNSGTIKLPGQLFFGNSCNLPAVLGRCTYRISVLSGKIRITHGEYTPDGGTWLSPPSGGRIEHYDLESGKTYEISVDIRTSFGKTDRITAVNTSLVKEAEFTYLYVPEERLSGNI